MAKWIAAVLALLPCCGRVGFSPTSGDAAPMGGDAAAATSPFLVVANGDGTASVYRVDVATRALQQTAQGDVQVGSPVMIGATPDGRFIYMPNFNEDTLAGFAIDPATGTLTAIPGTPTAEGSINLQAALVHPSGKYLYVVNGAANTVFAYAIDTASGALSLVGNIGTAAGGAFMPAIDPSGQMLYVSTYQTTIAGFAIDASTGAPSALTGSPFAVQSSNMIPVFDRTGRFLYLCANGTDLRGFVVDPATGALAQVPGSPYPTPADFEWLTTDPSGGYLLGGTASTTGLFVWAIDATSGALTPAAGSPFTAPADHARAWGAFTPDGRYFYAGSDYLTPTFDLSLYSFDVATGAVSVAATAIVPRSTFIQSMVLVQPGS